MMKDNLELVSTGGLKVGDRVKVSNADSYKCVWSTCQCKGKKGTVSNLFSTVDTTYPVEVKLDNSDRSVECFKSDDLMKVTNYMGLDIVVDKSIKEVKKLEKPTTKLEEDALKKAKDDAIKAEIESRALTYKEGMREYIDKEHSARKYRKEADELAEKLGITAAEKKQLF